MGTQRSRSAALRGRFEDAKPFPGGRPRPPDLLAVLRGYNPLRKRRKEDIVAEKTEITWDPEADRRIKRSPFLMRRFIRKRIEDRVAGRGRTHVTEADVDESAGMYRQYRFK